MSILFVLRQKNINMRDYTAYINERVPLKMII